MITTDEILIYFQGQITEQVKRLTSHSNSQLTTTKATPLNLACFCHLFFKQLFPSSPSTINSLWVAHAVLSFMPHNKEEMTDKDTTAFLPVPTPPNQKHTQLTPCTAKRRYTEQDKLVSVVKGIVFQICLNDAELL